MANHKPIAFELSDFLYIYIYIITKITQNVYNSNEEKILRNWR